MRLSLPWKLNSNPRQGGAPAGWRDPKGNPEGWGPNGGARITEEMASDGDRKGFHTTARELRT